MLKRLLTPIARKDLNPFVELFLMLGLFWILIPTMLYLLGMNTIVQGIADLISLGFCVFALIELYHIHEAIDDERDLIEYHRKLDSDPI